MGLEESSLKGKVMATPAQEQAALALTHPEPAALTPMDMLAQLMQHPNAKDAAEAMTALIQLTREERDLKAKSRFNDRLAIAQEEVKMVVNDKADSNFMKGKGWATYKALDKALRPIWTRHGFSLDFSSEPSPVAGQVIFTADLSLGMFTKTYKMPSAVSGEGAKGGGALSPQHAMSAGMEYGRKNLLKMIFNVITGDEEELMTTTGEMVEVLEDIGKCGNIPDLNAIVKAASDAIRKRKDGKAMLLLADARDKRVKELQCQK